MMLVKHANAKTLDKTVDYNHIPFIHSFSQGEIHTQTNYVPKRFVMKDICLDSIQVTCVSPI